MLRMHKMAAYHHFGVIFRTTLIEEEYSKVVIDPVTLEFFRGENLAFDVPDIGRIFPTDKESIVMKPVRLAFNPTSYFISVIARSDLREVRAAKQYCDDAVDREVTNLALVYGPSIFDSHVYRGAIIKGDHLSWGGFMKRADPVQLHGTDFATRVRLMRAAYGTDADVTKRHGLMSRFMSKAVALDPGEEKFLFLWTILEIFPMKNTTNIAPISEYLGHILGRPADEVKSKLEIGRMFGLRSELVHNGQFSLSPEETIAWVQRLENICLETLRSISGLPYGRSLDSFFV